MKKKNHVQGSLVDSWTVGDFKRCLSGRGRSRSLIGGAIGGGRQVIPDQRKGKGGMRKKFILVKNRRGRRGSAWYLQIPL